MDPRWSDPECQIEVVWATLLGDIKRWLRAEGVRYEEGAGVRSAGRGVASWLMMDKGDAERCRAEFAARLAEQRERFGLQ